MRCPVCDRLETGRVAADQYFCRRCCVEFHGGPGRWHVYCLDEEGNLVELGAEAVAQAALAASAAAPPLDAATRASPGGADATRAEGGRTHAVRTHPVRSEAARTEAVPSRTSGGPAPACPAHPEAVGMVAAAR